MTPDEDLLAAMAEAWAWLPLIREELDATRD